MLIKVRAKITGTHALTGIPIETGKEYYIDERFFGDQVFEKIEEKQTKKADRSDSSNPSDKEV